MRLISFFLLIGVVSILACSTSKDIIIYTSPTNASVLKDSILVGVTPFQTKVKFKNKDVEEFTLSKSSYIDTTVFIPKEPKELTRFTVVLRKKETVDIDLVSFVPNHTSHGVKLERRLDRVIAYLEVIERSPNVKSVTKVTNNEDVLAQIGEPVLSPKGDMLAYSVFFNEKGVTYSNIWMQPVGSPGRTRITQGNSIDLHPAFTHDGQYIYFSSNRMKKNAGIWRIHTMGGGGLTSITNTDAEDFGISVFPADDQIAYTSIPYGVEEPQLWTIRSSGTLPTQLREGRFPHVSPSGKRLAFTRYDPSIKATRPDTTFYPAQIWVMQVDGSGETQITQNATYNCIHPKWSPDGRWIVYASDEGLDAQGRHNYDIWMMRSDGTRKTQLTTNGSLDDSPNWSPDGKQIYFRSNRGGAWNIWYFEPYLSTEG
jgi:dipeptidyl aminopeptidase/acylaminoacyl peptidase